jgi:hypothetical protein
MVPEHGVNALFCMQNRTNCIILVSLMMETASDAAAQQEWWQISATGPAYKWACRCSAGSQRSTHGGRRTASGGGGEDLGDIPALQQQVLVDRREPCPQRPQLRVVKILVALQRAQAAVYLPGGRQLRCGCAVLPRQTDRHAPWLLEARAA